MEMCSNTNEADEEIDKELIAIEEDEDQFNDKNFGTLPTEVVERIFGCLTVPDLITVSAVCSKWCEISQLQKFRQKILLKIQHSKVNKHNCPAKIIEKSTRKFSNLYFGDQIAYPHKFPRLAFSKMSNIFSDLDSFKLENTKLTYEELCSILSGMKKLKSLSIIGCNFQSTITNETTYLRKRLLTPIKHMMNHLISFEFQATSIGKYEKLEQITNLLMRLQKLKPGFRKTCKLYSDATTETNILCSIIERNKSTLKELYIPTYQNKLPLSSVYQIDNLNLNTLSVDYDYYSPPATLSLDTFLQAHKNVIVLIVSVKSYKKLDLDLIATNMKLLERLEITADRKNIHNFNLHTISKFQNLKSLKVLKCPAPNFQSPELASNTLLKELQIQNMELTETDIINITEKLPNLETLILQSVPLTNVGLQSIIKNLIHLKYLNLDNRNICDSQVTEYGISGFDSILNEKTGMSIDHLENLQYLQLWGIRNISENCLINNFKFPKIRKIFICKNEGRSTVTLPILTNICKNCPRLEEFVFTN